MPNRREGLQREHQRRGRHLRINTIVRKSPNIPSNILSKRMEAQNRRHQHSIPTRSSRRQHPDATTKEFYTDPTTSRGDSRKQCVDFAQVLEHEKTI